MNHKKHLYDPDPDPVFHERIQVLAKQGYRGFTISNKKQHFKGVTVTASNQGGKIISATGSTETEAMKKLIDKIDLLAER